jgi:hypothetical protein
MAWLLGALAALVSIALLQLCTMSSVERFIILNGTLERGTSARLRSAVIGFCRHVLPPLRSPRLIRTAQQ